jgi:hypothetical protein
MSPISIQRLGLVPCFILGIGNCNYSPRNSASFSPSLTVSWNSLISDISQAEETICQSIELFSLTSNHPLSSTTLRLEDLLLLVNIFNLIVRKPIITGFSVQSKIHIPYLLASGGFSRDSGFKRELPISDCDNRLCSCV